jgi:hypothetical protein
LVRSRVVPPCLAACVAIACGDLEGAAPDPVARFEPGTGAVPPFMDVPFPSDLYLANGRVVEIPGMDRVVPQHSDSFVRELAQLDGFSRTAHAFFYVDDPGSRTEAGEIGVADVDRASLPRDEAACMADASSVFLVDLEASDPSKARLPCRAFFHDDRPFLAVSRPYVVVGPARGLLLEEKHRYAAVMTSRVKDTRGRAVRASAAFERASGLTREARDKAAALLAGALADGAKIVGIAPYTTNAMTRENLQARDLVEDLPVPVLAWDDAALAPMGAARFARREGGALPAGFTASLDEWLGVVDPKNKLPSGADDPDYELPVRAHDQIAAVGTAVFEAHNFLQSKPGGYTTLGHATFARDASGRIAVAPDRPKTKIWVTFAIPRAPMPATGYPAVIIQHGLSSSRAYLMSMANVFAEKGWIALAIDSVTFGARAPDPKYQVDLVADDYAKAPGSTYRGPDGLADKVGASRNGPSDFFGALTNFGALRDQLRQAALDTAQLVRVLRSSPDLSPLKTGAEAPRIDPDRIAYVGDSLGAVEGAVAAAIEPNVRAWFLNVGGGNIIMEAGNHGAGIGSLIGAAATAFGLFYEHLSESHLLINLVQTIIEPADPMAFAPMLSLRPAPLRGQPTKPRNVVLTEVLYDELLANEGGEALARAAGWGLAVPNVGSNAGTVDVRDASKNVHRVPLKDVVPDASGAIRDVPVRGATAVVVQVGPAEHGSNLVSAKGYRKSKIPYALWETSQPFSRLDGDAVFSIRNPYREVQATMTRFFGEAFEGKVPSVAGFKPPVRDFDDDGAMDDVDADPSNPNVK